jgi:hypothetical protein
MPGHVPGIRVTPAKAGVQSFCWRLRRYWIPACAGMTNEDLDGRVKPGHDEAALVA